MRLRIRTLEAINRELKEQLEAVYGELAVVQPKPGPCTERKNDEVIACESMLRGIPEYVVLLKTGLCRRYGWLISPFLDQAQP